MTEFKDWLKKKNTLLHNKKEVFQCLDEALNRNINITNLVNKAIAHYFCGKLKVQKLLVKELKS